MRNNVERQQELDTEQRALPFHRNNARKKTVRQVTVKSYSKCDTEDILGKE